MSDNLARFNWTAGAVRWADTIGPKVRTRIKDNAPRGKTDPTSGRRVKRLADSIRYQRETAAGTAVNASWTANTPYAKWVIYGTKPHIIQAKAARYLRFVNKTGQTVFAKRVHHPGTKPNPFHLRPLHESLPEAQELYTRIMREALGGM
jgi:hypothetical protein